MKCVWIGIEQFGLFHYFLYDSKANTTGSAGGIHFTVTIAE